MKHKRVLAFLLTAAIMFCGLRGGGAADMSYNATEAYTSSRYYQRLKAVRLTGDARTDALLVAFSQLGYHEGDSSSDLNGGNRRGTNNYTEYGYWFGTRPMGGSSGFYHAWCAFFVSWCARQAGVPESVISNAAYAKPDGSHRSGGYGYFHLDALSPNDYAPGYGDLIFIDWSADDSWDHVGFVFYCDEGRVATIEGNAEDCVRYRVYDVNDPEIRAYCAPAYGDGGSASGQEAFRACGRVFDVLRGCCEGVKHTLTGEG